MEVFKDEVERKIKGPRGRLTILIKYTSGEAKVLITNCIQQPLPENYNNALKLLKGRYGDPHKILATCTRDIKRWLVIEAGDPSPSRLYHTFLLKCQSITSSQSWKVLESPEVLSLMFQSSYYT